MTAWLMGLCCGIGGVDTQPLITVEGLQFEGTLKARNTWLRIGVKGHIKFKQGQFIWQVDHEATAGPTATYQTQRVGSLIHFKVTVPVTEHGKDVVQWFGTYDGQQLIGVTAEWTRYDADLIHDLLLPNQVIFDFMPTTPMKSKDPPTAQ